MKQLRMFKKETKVGIALLKADYQLCLSVLKMTYSHSTAISLMRDNFNDYFFSVKRHNQMIGGHNV